MFIYRVLQINIAYAYIQRYWLEKDFRFLRTRQHAAHPPPFFSLQIGGLKGCCLPQAHNDCVIDSTECQVHIYVCTRTFLSLKVAAVHGTVFPPFLSLDQPTNQPSKRISLGPIFPSLLVYVLLLSLSLLPEPPRPPRPPANTLELFAPSPSADLVSSIALGVPSAHIQA